MTWLVVALVALMAFLLLVLVFRLPRTGWEMAGTALLMGLVGYGLHGHPGQAGAPKPAIENQQATDEALIRQRQAMGESLGKSQSWLVLADGLSRNGQFGGAAQVLGKAVRENPEDADLWLALGNALVGHGDGAISPAAQFAFEKAAKISPEHPGPPFFLGLALAQSGRLPEARVMWQQLLDRSPPEAPWRQDLVGGIARIDAMIAASAGHPNQEAPQAQPDQPSQQSQPTAPPAP